MRNSGAPWKEGVSGQNRGGRQPHPPHRPAASAGGDRNRDRIRPFEGLAFLISAISAKSPRSILERIAAAKPRGASASVSRALSSASGTEALAAAISSRL